MGIDGMIRPRRAGAEPRHRPDVRTIVADLLETLRDARSAVDRERDMVLAASSMKGDQLRRLHQSLRSFGAFADRLLVVMCDRGLDGPLMEEAEQLYDFFRDMEAEIGDWLPLREA
jgi:hypothetical protein